MLALIDQYRIELEKINAFAASTIETYTIGVKAFCQYAKPFFTSIPPRQRQTTCFNGSFT